MQRQQKKKRHTIWAAFYVNFLDWWYLHVCWQIVGCSGKLRRSIDRMSSVKICLCKYIWYVLVYCSRLSLIRPWWNELNSNFPLGENKKRGRASKHTTALFGCIYKIQTCSVFEVEVFEVESTVRLHIMHSWLYNKKYIACLWFWQPEEDEAYGNFFILNEHWQHSQTAFYHHRPHVILWAI